MPVNPKPGLRCRLFLLDQHRGWTRPDYGYKVTWAGVFYSAAPHTVEGVDNHPAPIFKEWTAISTGALRHG